MSKYLKTRKGSLEDLVAGVTEGKQSEDYKQLFKKELEKAGKGIGAMSDQEKKDFFNKIDKMHTAKNEEPKADKMNKQQKSVKGESVELEEGGVKDFLMDVEADAGDMSLNDLIKKYYGQMGLTAQEIKKIYYRVNESVNEESEEKEEVKSLQQAIYDVWNQAAKEEETREDEAKWLKTEEKKSLSEVDSKIKCPACGHMNKMDAEKCVNCGASLTQKSRPANNRREEKKGKEKTMVGTPASKVDPNPEVEFDK